MKNNSLYILKNGASAKMTPYQIFDNTKYNELHIMTYSASPNFLLKYCSAFPKISMIVGIPRIKLQEKILKALKKISTHYDTYSGGYNFSLHVPKDEKHPVHEKIYLLRNYYSNDTRIIFGSANLTFFAMSNKSRQNEFLFIIDNNTSAYNTLFSHYMNIYNKSTKPFLKQNFYDNSINKLRKESNKPALPSADMHENKSSADSALQEEALESSVDSSQNNTSQLSKLNKNYSYVALNNDTKSSELKQLQNTINQAQVNKAEVKEEQNKMKAKHKQHKEELKHKHQKRVKRTKEQRQKKYYRISKLKKQYQKLYLKKEYSKCINILRMLLKNNFNKNKCYLEIGDLFYKLSKLKNNDKYYIEAVITYIKAMQHKDTSNTGKIELCTVLIHLHFFVLARDMLKGSLDSNANSQLYSLLGGMYVKFNTEGQFNLQFVNAIYNLEESIFLCPYYLNNYYKLIQLYNYLRFPDYAVHTKKLVNILKYMITNDKQYLNKTSNVRLKNKNYIKRLNQLIGLKNVKSSIKTFANQAYIEKLRDNIKGHQELHLVFEGQPGTGKTTVANFMCGILYQRNIIQAPKFVHINATDLIGSKYGSGSKRVKTVFQRAKGGVLFIDEAYELTHHSYNNSAAQDEAVNELVADAENHRKDIVIIMAGYTNLMEKLFARSNPGLSSRFPVRNRIIFPNYTSVECERIFELYMKQHNLFFISLKAKKIMLSGVNRYIEKHQHDKNFANARTVRNLFDIMFNQFSNYLMNKYKIKELKVFKKKKSYILNGIPLPVVINTVNEIL